MEFAQSENPVDVLARQCQDSLEVFVKTFWSLMEPSTPLQWEWYLTLMCEKLEAVTRKEIRILVIEIPPGFMKSLMTSVFWPAWEWLRRPEERTVCASYLERLVLRDARKMRRIVTSERYQLLLESLARQGRAKPWTFAKDQNAKGDYENTRTGKRFSVTVAGSVTGERGDKIIIDDPINARDALRWSAAQSAERMYQVEVWYRGVLASRFTDLRTARIVLIMQRLHEADLASVVRTEPDCEVLCLPAEFDPERAHPEDQRTQKGESLSPTRFPVDVLQAMRKKMRKLGTHVYSAQYQQDPVSAEGGTFKKSWMTQRYQRADLPILGAQLQRIVVSVDSSLGKNARADLTAIHVYGYLRSGRHLLLDREADQMDVPKILALIIMLRKRWRDYFKAFGIRVPAVVLIEDTANGPEVIRRFNRLVGGVVKFQAGRYGSKEARAELSTVEWDTGRFWLPDTEEAPWVEEYIRYLVKFGFEKYDDDVDAMSQYVIWITSVSEVVFDVGGEVIDQEVLDEFNALRQSAQTPGELDLVEDQIHRTVYEGAQPAPDIEAVEDWEEPKEDDLPPSTMMADFDWGAWASSANLTTSVSEDGGATIQLKPRTNQPTKPKPRETSALVEIERKEKGKKRQIAERRRKEREDHAQAVDLWRSLRDSGVDFSSSEGAFDAADDLDIEDDEYGFDLG